MNWVEIIGIILGSGATVAIVNLISKRLERKDTVEDKKNSEAAKEKSTADQLEELRAETSEQFSQVDTRFQSVEGKIDSIDKRIDGVSAGSRAQLYNTISHLSMKYIRANEISGSELKPLMDMFAAYKQLGGDGFLDKLMNEVGKLRIKPDD